MNRPPTAPEPVDITDEAVNQILDAVMDLPPERRLAKARTMCGADQRRWAKVRRILELDLQAAGFLQRTATDEEAPAEAAEVAAPGTPIGTRIGAWEVVGHIGRGGMGEVLEVRRADGQYQMRGALKRLHQLNPEHVERLQRERQILAALQHPHIAQLLDGGVDADNHPWMVMELVQGQALGDWSAQASLSARLDVFAQLLGAVAHAHAHLVVHRDIKPGNVLVGEQDQAKLLDFGIAKLITALKPGDQTQALATPNYAAPEQLLGAPVTVQTDVYGLGATLYALLCGRPPLLLDNLSLPSLVDHIRHQQPPAPSSISSLPGLSTDLDAICLKCLAKEPQQRYASVTELAADLRRLQSGFPVHARPPGTLGQVARFVRRHRVLAVATTAIMLAVISGLIATSWQARKATIERDIARQETLRLHGLRGAITQVFRSAAQESTALPARDLFQRAAAEAEARLSNDPGTAAALMQMLGELHLYNDDYPAARAMLERVLALPPQWMSPTVLADTHLDMAHLHFRDRDLVQTRAHIDAAEAIWSRAPDLFRNERIQALTLEAQMARSAGDGPRAIALLEQSVREHTRLWGRNHPDTAGALVNLAATQYYANAIDAAIATSEQAYVIYTALGQADSPDALNLLANWGVYALRAGRPLEAEKRLSHALDLRTKLYGASAAQAVLMKNLGLAHLANLRWEDGLALLEQSQWMAERYAGAESHLHAASACQLARIWLENADLERARGVLDLLPEALLQRDSHWGDFCRGLRHVAHTDPAQVNLDAELAALAGRGTQGLNYRAELRAAWAFQLLGAGLFDPAAELFALAVADKASSRGRQHYETLLLQLRQAEAEYRRGQTQAARELQRTALANLSRALGPTHPLVLAELDATRQR